MEEYVFHKQTYKEIKQKYGVSRRVMHHLLEAIYIKEKQHHSRPIHLVVDATYFGERKEGRSWCVLVARDPHAKENIAWLFTEAETTYSYVCLREAIEQKGYTILSVTGDGFSGIRGAFDGISFQMCHVHMERLVIQGTTRKPQTEAGCVLLAFAKTLQMTPEHDFARRLKQFGDMYHTFLHEKTIHPLTGTSSYTHEGVRHAYWSLLRFQRYLFTYEHHRCIPRTTNSLEGHFRHVKKYLGLHSGLLKHQQQKILAIILQASSVAPGKETLNTLWK